MPTVTAITTSQDLQWLVQPTLISSMAQSQPQGQPLPQPPPQPPAVDPYDLPGTSYSTPGLGAYSGGPAPPLPPRAPRARPRRTREETVSWADFGDILLLSGFLWGISNEVTNSMAFP